MRRLVLDHWVGSTERTPATGLPSIELTDTVLSGPVLTNVALWSHASRPWCSPTSFTVAAAPGDWPGAGSWPSGPAGGPARGARGPRARSRIPAVRTGGGPRPGRCDDAPCDTDDSDSRHRRHHGARRRTETLHVNPGFLSSGRDTPLCSVKGDFSPVVPDAQNP